MRQTAEEAGGISVGLMLDVNGSDVTSFGMANPISVAVAEVPPIVEVVVLLGGRHDIEKSILPDISTASNDYAGCGLHLGTMAMRLPGGQHHSYVALGDLLSWHDRGFLVPILEDHRHLGKGHHEAAPDTAQPHHPD